MVQYGSKLVVGSWSEFLDGMPLAAIMQWDGTTWGPLGPGLQAGSSVSALIVFGSDLVVGGGFETAAGDTNIARWDGNAWHFMGSGLAYVNALAVLENDLYAATDIGVYRWNGFTWVGLGTFDGPVYAMVPFASCVAVAGSFDTINGMPAKDFALWNGTSWIPIGGAGADWHFSMSLAVWNGELYAGGWFTKIDNVPVKGVARWNGTNWNAVGSENVGHVEELWVHDGDLYAVGSDPGVLVTCIARWDGTSWESVGGGLTGLDRLGDEVTTFNGKLVVLGQFSRAGGVPAWTIARWDGSTWESIGNPVSLGPDERPYVLGAYQGKLVAGGPFVTAGTTDARRIAILEGNAWQPLGSGVSAQVYAITEYNGDLVAGGNFLLAGGTTVNSIAAWNGASWSPLGSGMDAPVYALTVYDNDLIAGGEFTTAGGVAASCVARWDGTSWTPIGEGTNNAVWTLAAYQGKLIAGGPLTSPGYGIVQWDGSAWSPVGSGTDDYVRDIEVYGGQLIAGGDFFTAGGVAVRHIARWNGTSWNALDYGLWGTRSEYYSFVGGLTALLGKLYVTGNFIYGEELGSPIVLDNVARWTGSSWQTLDDGMDPFGFGTFGGNRRNLGSGFRRRILPFIEWGPILQHG